MALDHKSTVYKPLYPEKNPFERADKVFTDILAEHIKEKDRWRFIGFAGLVGAVIFAIACVFTLSRQKVEPVYIYESVTGEATYLGKGAQKHDVTRAEEEYVLRAFVRNTCSIPSDPDVLYQNIEDAYNYVTPRAEKILTAGIRANNPFERFGSVRRSVEIESVASKGDNEYQIDWIETSTGEQRGTERMRGLFKVMLLDPTAETIKVNPLGIYIDYYDIVERVQQNTRRR